MALTSRDIHVKEFHDAWRGYNQAEVDDFLDQVAEAFDAVRRENDALRRRIDELDETVSAGRRAEKMLKSTIAAAQKTAEEAISAAKDKAEGLIQEAERKARKAAEEANRRDAASEREHAVRKREIEESLARLKTFESDLKTKLVTFLQGQLRSLEQLDSQTAAERRRTAPAQASDRGARPTGDREARPERRQEPRGSR